MRKDFDTWNTIKKKLDTRSVSSFYHEKEVWWCSLGVNVGSEENGSGKGYQRPVLILKAINRSICFVVPLTTSMRQHRLRIPLGIVGDKRATALISQLRIIDTKRLVNRIAVLDRELFEHIRKIAKDLL